MKSMILKTALLVTLSLLPACTITADLTKVTTATADAEASVSSNTAGALRAIELTGLQASGMVSELRAGLAELRATSQRGGAAIEHTVSTTDATIAAVGSVARVVAERAATPILPNLLIIIAVAVGCITLAHFIIYLLERKRRPATPPYT